MTGLARSAAHTASDHATNPSVLVSCSLWTILSQRTIARRSSSGEGYGMSAAARHHRVMFHAAFVIEDWSVRGRASQGSR